MEANEKKKHKCKNSNRRKAINRLKEKFKEGKDERK